MVPRIPTIEFLQKIGVVRFLGNKAGYVQQVSHFSVTSVVGAESPAENRDCSIYSLDFDYFLVDIGEIGNVLLDSSCGFLCVTGGRIVRVFRNIPGYQVTALALQESLRFVSQDSVRIRLQQQLRDVQTLLDVCQQRYPRYTQMNA